MRVAIYGGTFNPIHIGHTSLAQSLIEQQLVDEVWLMVSPQNPHKDNDAAAYESRLEMACLATKGMKGISVSDFERNLPIPSYTHTTLTKLSEQYPYYQFYLVIGADNWANFRNWYRVDEIIKNYPILIYRRPNYDLDLSSVPHESNITIVITYTISDSHIGERCFPIRGIVFPS